METEERQEQEAVCATCGAPLWTVNGLVVCSRHWGHYPQPKEIVERHTPGWLGAVVEHPLPEIKTARRPPHRHNQSKILAWCKKHLVTHTTEEVGADGVKRIFTTYEIAPSKVKRQTPRVYDREYREYCSVMADNGMQSRPYSDWARQYETAQQRGACTV